MLVRNKGGIVWDLPEKEAKKRIEQDGFVLIQKKPETIEEIREKYSAKY